MTNPTLISLAYLKVNWDTYRSGYLDNFLPFLAECLKESPEDIITTQNLQKCFISKFGLQIPLHVIKALFNRGRKKGLLEIKNHVFYRIPDRLENSNFGKIQQKVLRCYSALIGDFQGFASEKYSVAMSEKEAEDAFLGFIGYNQLSIFLSDPTEKIIPNIPNLSKKNKMIISDYINQVFQADPQKFEYIETLVVGYMLVNAFYLADPQNIDRKFQKTKFFFDTSFIIYALGYGGEEMRAPCRELLELLHSNGARLCCFPHTVEEIQGILYACSMRLGKPDDSPFGRSVQYFTLKGYSQSDIQLLISQLPRTLENVRIKVTSIPSFEDHLTVIDETEFSDVLKKNMSFPREDAIARDVASISAIYRFRKGKSHFFIEDSEAVFVTTNNTLAAVSYDYYYQKNNRGTIPPCLTDYTLTNLVWLKTPSHSPTLPVKRIIADCFAAIQPGDVLMTRWLQEIEKLEKQGILTEDDYYFMRYSQEARTALMEISMGDEDVITDGTVYEIIERAKSKITREAAELLAKEKQNVAVAEKETAKLLQNFRLKEDRRKGNFSRIAHRIAIASSWVIRIGSLILLLTGAILSFPYGVSLQNSIHFSPQTWFRVISFIILVLIFILNILNQFFGVTVVSIVNKMEIWIEHKVLDALEKGYHDFFEG